MLPSSLFETNRIGRRGYRDADILAVRVAMLFFRQNNIRQTLSFLETSMGVRMTVGMKDVPSESVVSRRSKVLASTLDVDAMFEEITSAFYCGRSICHLSIDSTPIDAREKPVRKEKAGPKKRALHAGGLPGALRQVGRGGGAADAGVQRGGPLCL